MSGGRARSGEATADYLIAGLVVRSAIPLPAPAAPAGATPDVTVSEGRVSPAAHPSAEDARLMVEGVESDLRLRWPEIVSMRIEGGRSITVARDAGVATAAVAPLVLGVGFGLLLHQRGRLVLHASAVALPMGAVAFIGWKGAGKSTAAGAMLRRGHPVVTDDALPIETTGAGAPTAWPGPAPLKLWPESAVALGRSPRRLDRLHPAASKRVVPDVAQAPAPVPLLAIYSLEVGDDVAIRALAGAAGLVELMRHSYAPRFLPAAGATPAHFERCAQLAKSVAVCRLVRPPALDRLDEVAQMVEEHASSLASVRG